MQRMKHFGHFWTAILGLVLAGLLLYRLDAAPPLSWDEGWTFAVARNWLETGHFGQINNGVLQGPGLSASYLTVLPVALSFRLFGIGVWQGRLPGLLFMLGALFLLYRVAEQLYGRRTARAALLLLLFLPLTEQIHPLLFARQALGEPVMLFCLLAGTALFGRALQGRPFAAIGAGLFWALALQSKLQAIPFLLFALAGAELAALFRRDRPAWAPILTSGLSLWLAYRGLGWLTGRFLYPRNVASDPITGLLEVTAFVPDLLVRQRALFLVLTIGLPTLAALFWALRDLRRSDWGEPLAYQKLLFFLMTGAWFGWFALFSVFWARYFLPPLYFGAVFAAGMLADWTHGFRLRPTLRSAAGVFRRTPGAAGALAAVLLLSLQLAFFLIGLPQPLRLFRGEDSFIEAVAYLNTNTPEDALVESYDSPIFFLLERDYHFPPAQVNVAYNQRVYLGQEVDIPLDVLENDPDYLVVGPVARDGGLYAPWIESGAFVLEKSFGPYEIYFREEAP